MEVTILDKAFQLLCDQSLTDAARIIGLRMAALEDDWHELAPDDFAKMVSGYPRADAVRRHLRQLEMAGYIERKIGGRGHSDSFRFIASDVSTSLKTDRLESKPDANDLDSRFDSTLSAPVVEEGDGVTDKPPSSPFQLSERVEAAFTKHAEVLAGCRGALRDYLRDNVPTDSRRYAYVQSVASWMADADPSVWRLRDGGLLPKDERPSTLAAALNEIAAGDERTMKRPVGDPGNLKTKINILLKQRGQNGRSNGTNAGRNGTGNGDHETLRDEASGTSGDPRRRRSFGA